MRRNLISVFLAAVLVTIFCASYAQTRKPNIIVILTDDMGFSDIGAFGGSFVPTPNIDALAKNGLKLTQYYSAAPICSPSRAGMLTGMYPGRWNFTTYLDNKKHNRDAEQTDFLDPAAPSMGRVFQSAGYATGHFGKWHLGGGRDVRNAPGFEAYGFDAHISTYESPDPDPLITATNWIWSDKDSIKRWDRTRYFVDQALKFVQSNKGKPCFVNLWPDDVHTPWVPRRDDSYTGNFPMGHEDEMPFKLVLKELDVQIGRLVAGLKEMGELENTIIIFTSDNGALPSFRGSRNGGLRGSKLSLYEGGTRMPFIISWPGKIAAGRADNRSEVNAIDLLPSLAKMAGVKLPAKYAGDGLDRSAVFTGGPSLRNGPMFWEYGRNDIAYRYPKAPHRSPNLAVRSGEWKLLMNSDGSDLQLYNIVQDKNETTNLSEKKPQVAGKLKKELMAWWNSLPRLNK
ncbi:sulfatase-like hydrolase/transferase [Pedobacter deserti]|uniref:sulfatase-like hydrolase/transferase n=1 Tax=Pedobacter deserti TaxID=2817382 RepID=UPI00210A730A|nr:sulfatase-like hydrolase/transferase [Pedobacter sp. SYSU D00382]